MEICGFRAICPIQNVVERSRGVKSKRNRFSFHFGSFSLYRNDRIIEIRVVTRFSLEFINKWNVPFEYCEPAREHIEGVGAKPPVGTCSYDKI